MSAFACWRRRSFSFSCRGYRRILAQVSSMITSLIASWRRHCLRWVRWASRAIQFICSQTHELSSAAAATCRSVCSSVYCTQTGFDDSNQWHHYLVIVSCKQMYAYFSGFLSAPTTLYGGADIAITLSLCVCVGGGRKQASKHFICQVINIIKWYYDIKVWAECQKAERAISAGCLRQINS